MSQPITPKPIAASPKLSPAILRRLSRLEAETGFDVISDVPRRHLDPGRVERTEQQDDAAPQAAE